MGQSLERRGALVPPKIDIRGSEGGREREGHSPSPGERPGERESSSSSYSLTSRGTEGDLNTSVAVIPPMQICPGDLLVYSRVLAHKASGYGEILAFSECYPLLEFKYIAMESILQMWMDPSKGSS